MLDLNVKYSYMQHGKPKIKILLITEFQAKKS